MVVIKPVMCDYYISTNFVVDFLRCSYYNGEVNNNTGDTHYGGNPYERGHYKINFDDVADSRRECAVRY